MNEKYIIQIDGVNIECYFDSRKCSINEIIKEAFKEYVRKHIELEE